MSFISSLKAGYSKWKSEADQRAEKALKEAETKGEREKIKSKLAIEAAQRKRAIAKAETEQKEAELARKKADKELKGGSSFDFFGGLMKKPKAKRVVHRKSTKRKTTNKTTKTTTTKRKKTTRKKSTATTSKQKSFRIVFD